MTHSSTWGILLADDGTLDTVFICDACREEFRYNFAADSDNQSYAEFVECASADAFEQHQEDIES